MYCFLACLLSHAASVFHMCGVSVYMCIFVTCVRGEYDTITGKSDKKSPFVIGAIEKL